MMILEPPRFQMNQRELYRWLYNLWNSLRSSGVVSWDQIDKANASLADIPNRPHSVLQGIGQYTHSQVDAALDHSLKTISTPIVRIPILIGSIPVGATVYRASVIVSQVYDDPTTTITVGTVIDPTLFQDSFDNNPFGLGHYTLDQDTTLPAQTDIYCFITSGGTVGNGRAVIEYQIA